jgi:hypothetical protein
LMLGWFHGEHSGRQETNERKQNGVPKHGNVLRNSNFGLP